MCADVFGRPRSAARRYGASLAARDVILTHLKGTALDNAGACTLDRSAIEHAAVGVRDGTNATCALRDCGFRGVATATEGPGITVESGVEDGEAATAAAAPGPAQEPAPQEIAV